MRNSINAVTVSVDFGDILALTLPYNRCHFNRFLVVTVPYDEQTIKVAEENDCEVFTTGDFYNGGAEFAKYAGLEAAIASWTGRNGWMCFLDADTVWPREGDWRERIAYMPLQKGFLHGPFRHVKESLEGGIPPEAQWSEYPRHPVHSEFPGYTQIFHSEDEVLGPLPWHEVDWRHAGGGDSFFQMKWPDDRRIRLAMPTLSLGPHGVNWCGRSSPYVDGSVHPEAAARKNRVKAYIRGRPSGPRVTTEQRHAAEKLPPRSKGG